ncbi:hypothetical protein METBIDRAFT_23304, partial [Metschnikowia bicuspidata var. bicuspidata NRRL YB-4993]
SSTPIHVHNGTSSLFNSPLKKLDRLDLNNIKHRRASQSSEHDSQSDSDSNDEIANATVVEAEDSEGDGDHDPPSDPLQCLDPPVYVRKRKRADHTAMTPKFSFIKELHTPAEDMSGIMDNETNESYLKISFSASDSTPCPPQPRKKFRRNLQDGTPSQPSKISGPILNLMSSKKFSISGAPLVNKLDGAEKSEEDTSFKSSPASTTSLCKTKLSSTPISQSTPMNSRPGSPSQAVHGVGEKHVWCSLPRPDLKYSYYTPQPKLTTTANRITSETKDFVRNYHSNNILMPFENYKIVGDFPISAAGLMDEGDQNIHIADKRINDPYLVIPHGMKRKKFDDILMQYLNTSNRLPLLKHFESDLGIDEMKLLINDGKSVRYFYEEVLSLSDYDTRDFLKRERIRWHPDKWGSRLADSCFDMSLIGSLSLVINVLLEE